MALGVGCLWWGEQHHDCEGFADVGEVVVDASVDGDDCAGTNVMILYRRDWQNLAVKYGMDSAA